jgi:hypothetical protein
MLRFKNFEQWDIRGVTKVLGLSGHWCLLPAAKAVSAAWFLATYRQFNGNQFVAGINSNSQEKPNHENLKIKTITPPTSL